MQYEKIKVNPVTARVGAEIEGVDLSKPMDDRTFEEVHQALTEHCVIFFRGQDLDHESQKRLVGALASCMFIPPFQDRKAILKFCRSILTRTRLTLQANAGIRMCRAMKSHHWVQSFISRLCRSTAAIRSSQTCMPPMMRCRIA